MSYYDNPSKDFTAQISDSDEESMFYVNTNKNTNKSICKLPINKRIAPKGALWNHQEKEQYINFLKTHFDLMEKLPSERRVLKIYWMMSSSINFKNYAQCRIRHSRFLKQYGNVEGIIKACLKELKGYNGSLEKMQQYGLQVEAEEEHEQKCIIDEKELWAMLDVTHEIYYQNQLAP